MDAHSVVDDWDAAPFDGGFVGLDTLASSGFSGAVEARETWLFFRDGDPIAVVSDLDTEPRPGDIDAFDGATGQGYEAPNAAVATLAAMLALGGDVRGRYFTDDTPLEAVDETLSGGGFSGYVELSENVLSGDYYFVYVDGAVEHVGFVGSSQLLLGTDAEDRANSEVGVYDVTAVELPNIELPDPPAADDAGDTRGAKGDDAASEAKSNANAGPESAPDPESTDVAAGTTVGNAAVSGSEEGPDPETLDSNDAPPEASPRGSSSKSNSNPAEEEPGDSGPDRDEPKISTAARSESETEDRDGTDEIEPGHDTQPTDGIGGSEPTDGDHVSAPASKPGDGTDAATQPAGLQEEPDRNERRSSPAVSSGGRGTGGIEAVTTRMVPSLDPENSGRSDEDPEPSTSTQRSKPLQRTRSVGTGSESATDTPTNEPSSESADQLREAYESRIETYESRIDALEASVQDSDERIGELEAELEAVRAERDDLKSKLESGDVDTVSGTRSMTATEALVGTSLFIRETTRGEGTLEDAHDGTADRETVAKNLRIEYHTTFDDGDVSVDGEPFESWLRSSDTYRFAEWLVMELLFEIRSTGSIEALGPLYHALPGVDRIGFDETIAVGDGTEGREVTFDIVARDKKGNPLVVIEFDRQRDPTRAESIEPLVTDASDVCEEHESLAGAVAITSSYFESDAMGAVEEATSTSLLSRSKHRSYVKLSRSSGYHLCLVEARDGSFNLTVPEL